MAGSAQAWSSRFGFLMASVGFAVGLGNIWRFPYVTGENGGSAFVVMYLVCAFGIGVPILMAEIMLGRKGGLTPPGSTRRVAELNGRSGLWASVGYLNLLTAFSILTAYGVVSGWVLYYLYQSIAGSMVGFDVQASNAHFAEVLSDVPLLISWTFVALAIAGVIIYAGVQKGIERAVTILMPTMFTLLLGLAVFNVFAGGMPQALDYLFTPDFSKVSSGTLLAAVGQAFFSIGVAMAGMMMYGAYLPKRVSIGHSAIVIVTADTGVALLAGLVIFPMVFHNGLDPSEGTGLLFQTLPVAFAQMAGGHLVSVLFFLLLSVAAITSVVGLSEPLGAWLSERFGWSRHRSAVTLIACALGVGLISVLSYNHWADVTLFGSSLGRIIDFVPSQVLLPLGGFLIALFVGWFVSEEQSRDELALSNPASFILWHRLVRYIVMPAVAVILVTGVRE